MTNTSIELHLASIKPTQSRGTPRKQLRQTIKANNIILYNII